MADATALREAMVAGLVASGVVTSDGVAEALRAVPRHRFLPGVELEVAYADNAVVTKRRDDGAPLSSVSQPTMVATMLEQLRVVDGQHVLEIGTGSGYNAALLDRLVGATGSVTTVELEPDLAEGAAQVLRDVGAGRVHVVTGDGRAGHRDGAPYDRVVVTAGAPGIADAWTEQLVDGGRIVVPVVDDAGLGSVVTFDQVDGELVRRGEVRCGFLVLRSAPER